jgi:hypothetical protein
MENQEVGWQALAGSMAGNLPAGCHWRSIDLANTSHHLYPFDKWMVAG